MMIKLVPAKEMSSEQVDNLSGLRAFGSNFCLEHNVACIIACPTDQPLDLRCALDALDDMRRRLIDSSIEAAHEN